MNIFSATAFETAGKTPYTVAGSKLDTPVGSIHDTPWRSPAAAYTDGAVATTGVASKLSDNAAAIERYKLDPVFFPVNPMVRTVITTGHADDLVEINRGADNRIHVQVNGKDVWSGTPREFASVRIDTGFGNDTVINRVDGAVIDTGVGNDTVHNFASNSQITTGPEQVKLFEDQDVVVSHGSNNTITTGKGNDRVTSTGHYNTINIGEGGDVVNSTGNRNRILGGIGWKAINVYGNDNSVNVASIEAHIKTEGKNNTVRTGIDFVRGLFGK